MNFSICITTFSKRFEDVKKLIEGIRKFTDQEIVVVVNGDYNQEFDEEFRKEFLEFIVGYRDIFPIFFPNMRGMSKLWNTLIVHSSHEWMLVLSDDVVINSNKIFDFMETLNNESPDLLTINGCFAHFVAAKQSMEDLGYFDERLLGFGHEDGDMIWRYHEKYKKILRDVYIDGISHNQSNLVDEEIEKQIGCNRYSKFNSDFCFKSENPKYVFDKNGVSLCFGYPVVKNIQDENLYPYEKFYRKNKNNL